MAIFVIIAVLVAATAALFYVPRERARGGGERGLKRRFGPEYERAVARHNGDVRGAERELGNRVKRHGSLKEAPLSSGARELYVARWADIQRQFVASPRKAVTEADALLAHLSEARGFPGGEQFEERMAALSVHHPHRVHGYRGMHAAVRGQRSTEEMREAVLEAHGLFEALVTEHSADSDQAVHGPPTTAATLRGR
ncbi:hypothetical protein [Streptomyces armeniacus]|uniref:hypothetical protein n=1 Tax=Streptomyces armeniacus TaxID=83291 RepID=UPI001FE30EFF|nr:hypothetical protein [Streptomyces armeniacus]